MRACVRACVRACGSRSKCIAASMAQASILILNTVVMMDYRNSDLLLLPMNYCGPLISVGSVVATFGRHFD